MSKRMPETVEQVDPTHVRWRGGRYVYYGGCDYLKLAWHRAIRREIEKVGKLSSINVGASRLTTGNHPVYGETEKRLAQFFRAPAASLVASGYLTNLFVAQAFRPVIDVALIDELAHPSLGDAARLLEAKVVRFRHLDARDLQRKLGRVKGRLMVLTDAVFAQDGRLAPLPEYHDMLPEDGMLLADDCHGAGVLGANGGGSLEHWRIGYRRVIQTVTFSKAFGVYGGAVIGSKTVRRRLLETSGGFAGSTPPPPAMVAGVRKAVQVMSRANKRRDRLYRNCRRLTETLGMVASDFPVLSIIPKTSGQQRALFRKLVNAGIHPPFIRYPGGTEGGFFRFAISSEHSGKQLDELAAALQGNCG